MATEDMSMTSIGLSPDFAILTAVPEDHLRTGVSVAQISGYLALGCDKPGFFEEVDTLRQDCPVLVLFYASHRDGGAPETYTATWVGWYVGQSLAKGGQHREGMAHRPPSTASDGAWEAFYHIVGLRELTDGQAVRVDSLEKYKSPGERRANARVRAPGLVRRPGA